MARSERRLFSSSWGVRHCLRPARGISIHSQCASPVAGIGSSRHRSREGHMASQPCLPMSRWLGRVEHHACDTVSCENGRRTTFLPSNDDDRWLLRHRRGGVSRFNLDSASSPSSPARRRECFNQLWRLAVCHRLCNKWHRNIRHRKHKIIKERNSPQI
jgi:hypothetical protein